MTKGCGKRAAGAPAARQVGCKSTLSLSRGPQDLKGGWDEQYLITPSPEKAIRASPQSYHSS